MILSWPVIVCAVLAMVIGFIWYGPLFGKKWLEVVGAMPEDIEARKEMQKKAMPLYLVQFLMTLFQVWILGNILHNTTVGVQGAVTTSLVLFAAFVLPIVAGSAMWNNDSSRVAWTRFLLQGGYQLVLFVVFGLVLGIWR